MSGRSARLLTLLALAPLLASPGAQARQQTAAFNVDISLAPAQATAANCQSRQSAAAVTCRSGDFFFGAWLRRDELVLEGDGFAALGTTADYRVVSTPERQYLELVIGW